MRRPIAAITSLAIAATMAASAPTLAHTGGITDTQSCDTGTVITVSLDDNVADTATWTVTVRGAVIDSGNGPGPDSWEYSVGRAAGSASLVIRFEADEVNAYSTSWPAITGCHYRHPAAWLTGPCGDPMHRPVYDNRKSNLPTTFRLHRIDGGRLVVTKRTVPAGIKVIGAPRHFDGSTAWSITAHGRTLNHGISAPAGNYRACRDHVA